MIRLILVANGIHLEAARRRRAVLAATRRRGIELLLWDRDRCRLSAADRRLWPWHSAISPLTMAVLAGLARLGLVRELAIAHRRGAGRALRLLLRLVPRLELLDDGLDQYRDQPRAIDPSQFAAGTPYWLFSDAASHRATWCARFDCLELGPLYQPDPAAPVPDDGPAAEAQGTLLVDAPGLERLQAQAERLSHPWWLIPHPVRSKQAWRLPLKPADRLLEGPPEPWIARFEGLVVVGESMTLLAAARLRLARGRWLVVLPQTADPNLQRLARALVAADAGAELV
ncbi:MAG: hypothetical protein WCQ20_05790 [Synechococcaceae cyanobacterium ELA739]|jgi:hypothetical protein